MTTQSNTTENIASFIEEVAGESHLRIESDLGDGFVRLKSSEAERRQAAQDIRCSEDIVIEMLRNSRDAHAKNIFIGVQREDSLRTITILDDGDGIPKNLHATIFEPRVTSKLDTAHMDKWGMHGRGMALFSIAENAQSAQVVASQPGLGSSIQVVTNLDKLPEKSDQSSFPSFEIQPSGAYAMRGPKNITRISAEFALEHRISCSVWIGSPAEIVATMYELASSKLDVQQRIFADNTDSLPIVLAVGTVFDAQELASLCSKLGLVISSRTAQRILNGEVEPLPSLIERLQTEGMRNLKQKFNTRQKTNSSTAPKLTNDELLALKSSAKEAFAPIADAHYLTKEVSPVIRVSKGLLSISIPLVELDGDDLTDEPF